MLVLGTSDRPARAATLPGVCNGNGMCSFTGSFSGDTYTVNYNTNGTGSFSVSGQDSGSGTFNFSNTSNSVTIIGTETIDGITSPLNCTITSSGSYSGQCGPIAVLFGGTGNASAAAVRGAAQTTVRSQVDATTAIIATRVQSISRDIARSKGNPNQQSEAPHLIYNGMSAGSPDHKWGFWVDGSGSYISDDSAVSSFEGYTVTGLAGVDYNIENTWLVGFSAGYVRTDVSVKMFGPRVADGAQFGPYASYIISSHFTVDALFNYTRLSNAVIGTPSYNSSRYTGATNFNAFYDVGQFSLTGFLGYVYALENPDNGAPAFIGTQPTTVHYSAVKLGGEAAYPMGNFEPYIPLTLAYETTDPHDGTGRFGVTVGAGFRYQLTDQVKAGFVATTEEGRTHSTDVVAAANLRIVF